MLILAEYQEICALTWSLLTRIASTCYHNACTCRYKHSRLPVTFTHRLRDPCAIVRLRSGAIGNADAVAGTATGACAAGRWRYPPPAPLPTRGSGNPAVERRGRPMSIRGRPGTACATPRGRPHEHCAQQQKLRMGAQSDRDAATRAQIYICLYLKLPRSHHSLAHRPQSFFGATVRMPPLSIMMCLGDAF